VGLMLASSLGLGYWFVQQYRETPFSVIVMFSIFSISFIFTFILFCYQKLKPKEPTEKQWYETPENELTAATPENANTSNLLPEKSDVEPLSDQNSRLLKEVDFLIGRVRSERQNISDYVELEDFGIEGFQNEGVPVVTFHCLIRNKSVFDITLDGKIEGYIKIRGIALRGEKGLVSHYEVAKSANQKWFLIENSLMPETFDAITKLKDLKLEDFDLTHLELTIKGTDKFPQVEPQKLKIDRFPEKDRARIVSYKGQSSPAKKQEDSPKTSKEKPIKRNPVITCTKTKLDDVVYDSSKVLNPHSTKDSYSTYEESKALIIEFFNKPLTNVKSIGELKAIVTFVDENNKKEVIKSGIWIGRYADNSRFDEGDYLELSVALMKNNTLYLLERERLENPTRDNFSSYNRNTYNFRELNGKTFLISVDLVAKDFSRNVITSPKNFQFILKLKPKFEFTELKPQKA
jgi:hypothetical protein